ncbi:MAG: hypothetical protein LUG51_08110 [Tannerellaceae bacterium]|nr:hypothetical protein [Tannerellaceae bacterium]
MDALRTSAVAGIDTVLCNSSVLPGAETKSRRVISCMSLSCSPVMARVASSTVFDRGSSSDNVKVPVVVCVGCHSP